MVILGAPKVITYFVQISLPQSMLMPWNCYVHEFVEVATIVPQVAVNLLRWCGCFFKLVYLARVTPSKFGHWFFEAFW